MQSTKLTDANKVAIFQSFDQTFRMRQTALDKKPKMKNFFLEFPLFNLSNQTISSFVIIIDLFKHIFFIYTNYYISQAGTFLKRFIV